MVEIKGDSSLSGTLSSHLEDIKGALSEGNKIAFELVDDLVSAISPYTRKNTDKKLLHDLGSKIAKLQEFALQFAMGETEAQKVADQVHVIEWVVEGVSFYDNPDLFKERRNGSVKDLLNDFQSTFNTDDRNVTFLVDDFEENDSWSVVPGYLFCLLDNCVQNAQTHGKAERIFIKAEKIGDSIKIMVDSNAEEGISSDALEKVFVEGYTTKDNSVRPAGLGLSRADELVAEMGGKAEVKQREPNNQAVFEFTFPLLPKEGAAQSLVAETTGAVDGTVSSEN